MPVLPWFVVALLVTVNALYVAAEFAAVAAQRSQIARLSREGDHRARALLQVLQDGVQLDRYIAACQIGITLSSLVAGAYAQATIALSLGPAIAQAFDLEPTTAHSAAALGVLLTITALQVVLGELVPKSVALQFPERVALATYLPMRWSVSFYRAFIAFFNGAGFLMLKPFGIKPGGHQHVHSPEEIDLLFAESRQHGMLSPEAHKRLQRGLHLSTRTVRTLMVPRQDIVALDASTPPDELVRRMVETPYGRLPVYRDALDNVIGTVSTKDFVGLYAAKGKAPPLEQLLRPIPFVPETVTADRLVRVLQQQRSSKAVVVNEFGGVQGIVSIEDVLSALFGDIGDELKEAEPDAQRLPDGDVRLSGAMSLAEAEQFLGVHWQGTAATLGGHVTTWLGRMPRAGERFEIDGVDVTILEMGRTAVRWLLVRPARPEQTDPTAGDVN